LQRFSVDFFFFDQPSLLVYLFRVEVYPSSLISRLKKKFFSSVFLHSNWVSFLHFSSVTTPYPENPHAEVPVLEVRLPSDTVRALMRRSQLQIEAHALAHDAGVGAPPVTSRGRAFSRLGSTAVRVGPPVSFCFGLASTMPVLLFPLLLRQALLHLLLGAWVGCCLGLLLFGITAVVGLVLLLSWFVCCFLSMMEDNNSKAAKDFR
jgi:hypothetical protein